MVLAHVRAAYILPASGHGVEEEAGLQKSGGAGCMEQARSVQVHSRRRPAAAPNSSLGQLGWR